MARVGAVARTRPQARRVAFLAEVKGALDLAAVEIVRARAEEPAATAPDGYDTVVARAVAPLDRLVTLAAPLLRAGGEILALKGARAQAEVDGARSVLRRVGGRADVLACPLPGEAGTATVVRVAVDGSPTRPRRSPPTDPGSRARHR